MADKQVRVTQVKSSIGSKPKAKGTLRALGLGRIGLLHPVVRLPEMGALQDFQSRRRSVHSLKRVDEPENLRPRAATCDVATNLHARGHGLFRERTNDAGPTPALSCPRSGPTGAQPTKPQATTAWLRAPAARLRPPPRRLRTGSPPKQPVPTAAPTP